MSFKKSDYTEQSDASSAALDTTQMRNSLEKSAMLGIQMENRNEEDEVMKTIALQ